MMRLSFNLKSFCLARQLIFWVSFLSLLPLEMGLVGKTAPSLAQVSFPTCQAPLDREFLLLINTPNVESQERLRNSIPTQMNQIVCRYNDQIVTRLGGFRSLDEADRFGKYVVEVVGLPAVIATPRQSQILTEEFPSPSNQPNNPPTVGYNPQPLGRGYVVLVNYFNRPETANELRTITGKEVGLGVYLGNPYLLALQTNNMAEANQLLMRLTNQGFWAVVADSQRVIVLTSQVRY